MNLNQMRRQSLQNHLTVLYSQARSNLLLMLGLTVFNLVLLFSGAGFMLLFSATMPYFAVFFGVFEETGTLLIPCFLFAAGLLIGYFLCWLFSKKNYRWILAALVMFALDTVCLVVYYVWARYFTGVWDALIHAWVLYHLINGVRAGRKLEQLPPEELSYGNDFRLEDDLGAGNEAVSLVPKAKGSRSTDWKFDFTTLPHWKTRLKIPYLYDLFLPFEKAELLFCVHSVAEVTMMNYRGFFTILENKESPRVVFTSRKGIFGPNLYADDQEKHLCFEAYCEGKGSVMLLYSINRKAFAILKRNSGNPAGACFSKDGKTVILVEQNRPPLQFAMDTLLWLPVERLEKVLEENSKI
jgi:hypothetical protein